MIAISFNGKVFTSAVHFMYRADIAEIIVNRYRCPEINALRQKSEKARESTAITGITYITRKSCLLFA
jgi:hypothetical protein